MIKQTHQGESNGYKHFMTTRGSVYTFNPNSGLRLGKRPACGGSWRRCIGRPLPSGWGPAPPLPPTGSQPQSSRRPRRVAAEGATEAEAEAELVAARRRCGGLAWLLFVKVGATLAATKSPQNIHSCVLSLCSAARACCAQTDTHCPCPRPLPGKLTLHSSEVWFRIHPPHPPC